MQETPQTNYDAYIQLTGANYEQAEHSRLHGQFEPSVFHVPHLYASTDHDCEGSTELDCTRVIRFSLFLPSPGRADAGQKSAARERQPASP